MNNEPTHQLYVVVVGIDFSEPSALALREATRLARLQPSSAIHVLHTLPRESFLYGADSVADPSSPEYDEHVGAVIKQFVENALGENGRASPHKELLWTIHIRHVAAAEAVVQLAADVAADLVVIGTHGKHGLERFLLGSVADAVVRRAPCPVLVVREVGAAAAVDAPRIEPPCAACLEVRQSSNGAQFWCDRHREHHPRAHTFHFTPFRDSRQSGLLIHPAK